MNGIFWFDCVFVDDVKFGSDFKFDKWMIFVYIYIYFLFEYLIYKMKYGGVLFVMNFCKFYIFFLWM